MSRSGATAALTDDGEGRRDETGKGLDEPALLVEILEVGACGVG